MTRRESRDVVVDGVVKDGFDYGLQVWIEEYIIQSCGHHGFRESCCACRFSGEDIRNMNGREDRRNG